MIQARSRAEMQAMSLLLHLGDDLVAVGILLVVVQAGGAAEDDGALIFKNPVDHTGGFAIYRAKVIDGWAAFGKDGREADEGEDKDGQQSFHGGRVDAARVECAALPASTHEDTRS